MIGGAVDTVVEISLDEGQFEGGEFRGKEGDGAGDREGRDEDGIKTVDDAVGTEL